MATRSVTYEAAGTVFTVHKMPGNGEQTPMIIGRKNLATWLMLNLLFTTARPRNVSRIGAGSSEMIFHSVNTASGSHARQFLVSHLQLLGGEHSVGATEENLTWPSGNVAGGLAEGEASCPAVTRTPPCPAVCVSEIHNGGELGCSSKMLGVRVAYVEVMAFEPHTSFLPSPCLLDHRTHFLSLLKLILSQNLVWGSLSLPNPDPFRGCVKSQLFY